MKRRQFLQTACTAAVVPFFIPRSVFADAKTGRPSANDRIGLAGIGVGRQGGPTFNSAASDPRTQVVAVCDVYRKRGLEFAAKHKIPETDAVQDYRKIIDNKNVDAIVTATPEHWRSIICVNAMLAGKHLYVEKPITLTVEDGILFRKAAAKTGITFQSGSQQRSEYIQNRLVRKFIEEGHIGKVKEVIAGGYESPWLYGMSGEPIPEGLDWELWCGPEKLVPFHSQLFVPRGKPGWISFREYSGGEITGWGTHGFDQIQNALGKDNEGPVEILVDGDKLVPPVWKEPQDKKIGDKVCSQPKLAYRYADGIVVKLDDAANKGDRGGGTFIGEKGTIYVGRGKFTGAGEMGQVVKDFFERNKDVKRIVHTTNWIDCIYSGREPNTPLETAIRTTEICHILNIARYVGHNLNWDPKAEKFVGAHSAEANKYLVRQHRKGYEQPKVDDEPKRRNRPNRPRLLGR